MAEIVNLNHVRKARAKASKAVESGANRVKFGRTRAEKRRDTLETERRDALLDGARRDDD